MQPPARRAAIAAAAVVALAAPLAALTTASASGAAPTAATSSAASVQAAPRADGPTFSDVGTGDAFYAEIERMAGDGVMTGYADGTFRPQAPVTRDALAAFLYRLVVRASYRPPTTPMFADVPVDHPFYTEISWLAQQGISTGWQLADGRRVYRPGAQVTREALATFLHRLAGTPHATRALEFADVGTGHPFHDAIAWLAGAGISTGWDVGGAVVFRPSLSIERQAMAAFLVRFDDLRLCVGAPVSDAGTGGRAGVQASQPGGPPGQGGQLPPGHGGDSPPGLDDGTPGSGTRTSLSC